MYLFRGAGPEYLLMKVSRLEVQFAQSQRKNSAVSGFSSFFFLTDFSLNHTQSYPASLEENVQIKMKINKSKIVF